MKNFFQYANWVFNKNYGQAKYYVLRRHWEEYLKKEKDLKSQTNIKEGGRKPEQR